MATAVEPEFEETAKLVVEWMVAHGFPDATLTEDAGAGVYDVESTRAIAEINVAAPPSRPNVQRLDTVSRNAGRPALYFSVRGFTTSAEEWANNVNIALFAFDKQSDAIVPVNEAAEEYAKAPPSRDEQLLSAAERAMANLKEELHEEQQFAGVDDATKARIQAARETKRMRRNLFG